MLLLGFVAPLLNGMEPMKPVFITNRHYLRITRKYDLQSKVNAKNYKIKHIINVNYLTDK